MESVSIATKRKKRKTRKCLDELRKRSRRNNMDGSDTLKKNPFVGKLSETVVNLNGARPKNYITSDRLTLAMLPKAIRSETITRAIVPESKQNQVNNKIVKDGRPISTVTSSSHIQELSYSDSDVIRNSDEESVFVKHNNMVIQKDSDGENVSQREGSPSSFILFSPMVQRADTDIFDESPNGDTLSSLTTPTSQSSREGYGYHLYEEFMDEIPIYLKENAPALVKDDVMKKTRTFLHNIYMESCRRECEDNILQCIKNSVVPQHRPFTPKVAISQNSMDYIRVGYSWRQSVAQKLNVAGSASAESSAREPGGLKPALATHEIIHDTPEYTFYPHKLNQ